jgi:hypothetical protein
MKKYNGLRKKPTFDELIHYLNYEQPKIKYPNRDAYFLSQSPEMLQFIGGGGMDDDIQSRLEHEQSKEQMLRAYAQREGISMAQARAIRQRPDYHEIFSPLLGPSAEDRERQEDEAEERSEMLESYEASSKRSESKRAESIAGSLPPLEQLEEALPAPTLTQEILDKKEEERKHSKQKEESRESAETEDRETQRKASKGSEASSKSLSFLNYNNLPFSEKLKYLEKRGVDPIAQIRTKYPSLNSYSDNELKNIEPHDQSFSEITNVGRLLSNLYNDIPSKQTEEQKPEESNAAYWENQSKEELKEFLTNSGESITTKITKLECLKIIFKLYNIPGEPNVKAVSGKSSSSKRATSSSKRAPSKPPTGGGLGRSSDYPPIPK